MDPSILKQAAEFGVIPFLFTLLLMGVGFGVWKLSNKMADSMAEIVKTTNATSLRNSEAIERIGDAVEKISSMTSVLAVQANEWKTKLENLEKVTHRHTRATRIMIDALREVVPADRTRAIQLLEEAKRHLDVE
jgi:methyl-accepting chemotaxis protein